MDILDTFAALPRSARLGCGIPAFFRKTLPSGLLSVQVWVKTGSIHEEEFLGGGLSHYLEHMAFKGTEKYGAEEIVRRVQAVGGSLNAYTSFDRTVYYADVPAEAAETAFKRPSTRFRRSCFPRGSTRATPNGKRTSFCAKST